MDIAKADQNKHIFPHSIEFDPKVSSVMILIYDWKTAAAAAHSINQKR